MSAASRVIELRRLLDKQKQQKQQNPQSLVSNRTFVPSLPLQIFSSHSVPDAVRIMLHVDVFVPHLHQIITDSPSQYEEQDVDIQEEWTPVDLQDSTEKLGWIDSTLFTPQATDREEVKNQTPSTSILHEPLSSSSSSHTHLSSDVDNAYQYQGILIDWDTFAWLIVVACIFFGILYS